MGYGTQKSVLTVDVGNSTTRFGVFCGDEVQGTWEATTHSRLTVDEARLQVRTVVRELCGDEVPDGAILSCVVPLLSDTWAQALTAVSASRPLVVGPGLKSGVRMRYDDPSEVGSDRVADVVAAREAYGAPVVVVDLGTTTNITVVDEGGIFVGGIIAPGMRLGARALSEAAARLATVELRAPKQVIGKNTRAAMQSGVVLGEVARIDGLLDAMSDELGYDVTVVLTGDDAQTIAALLRHDATVDENLTLRGLALIWQANKR